MPSTGSENISKLDLVVWCEELLQNDPSINLGQRQLVFNLVLHSWIVAVSLHLGRATVLHLIVPLSASAARIWVTSDRRSLLQPCFTV